MNQPGATFTDEDLEQRVRARDTRAIARLITLVENRVPRARKIQAELFKSTGRVQVIGVTGAPGAGKSTLVDQLAFRLREQSKQVAILAVDPSSPFSGGAVLGDRIRMSRCAESDVFIRSMATRGALGGLSAATYDAIQILDAAGFDTILVETVGVGQAEVDVVRMADTCLVVLVPGMGDIIQALKAGILEIADLFVVNKADREGANHLERDLKLLLSLEPPDAGSWLPSVVRTVATAGEGTEELLAQCSAHVEWLRQSDHGRKKRMVIMKDTILRLAGEQSVAEALARRPAALDDLADACLARKIDPYTAARQLLAPV